MMHRVGWAILLATVLISCMTSQRADTEPSAMGIEDSEWQLIEVGGAPVSPLPGERQPFITFDETKKRATGFSGCNNFFGSYELNGSSLVLGPIAATRKFCAGAAGEAEMKFMAALEQSRRWELRDGALLLLIDGEVLARLTLNQGAGPDLLSMTFLSTGIPAGKVTLAQGEYREPAAHGSASEIIVKLSDKKVFGVMNGRQYGAVVLVTDPGGSGTFYDLALLTKETEGWVNTDIVLLGDRVKVHSVAIENNQIAVSMTAHGPNDPMCCPTLDVKKRFGVKEDSLIPLTEGSKEEEPRLTGSTWQWVQTLYNNDTKNVPQQPGNYTIQFLEDGKLTVKADCNLKGGTYSTDGKKLSIVITHSTMAACEEGSLEEFFVRDLTGGAIFFFKDGDLYIDIKYDTGTMKFTKQ